MAFYHITTENKWDKIASDGWLQTDEEGQTFVLNNYDIISFLEIIFFQIWPNECYCRFVVLKINLKASDLGGRLKRDPFAPDSWTHNNQYRIMCNISVEKISKLLIIPIETECQKSGLTMLLEENKPPQ